MFLTGFEIEETNRAREFIINTTNRSLLLRCKCRSCDGTGLSNYGQNSDGVNWWDGSSYCDFCKGIGYVNPKELDTSLYECCVCHGEGFINKNPDKYGYSTRRFKTKCPNCKGFGFINWLENLLGKEE